MSSLALGLIGNSNIGALVDAHGDIVWACMPRFDSEPVFDALLRGPGQDDLGRYRVELIDCERVSQQYVQNTAILITTLEDKHGGVVELTDFAPKFKYLGRMFRPISLVRHIKPLAGSPRIRICARPSFGYGQGEPDITHGSNHIRYLLPGLTLRLTTDASITTLLDKIPFVLESPVTLLLGPDESLSGSPGEVGRSFYEETRAYWREWVRDLGIPFEWQDAVIRAAITLKLNSFDDTGAVIAAVTTSIPESPDSGRNWDYRYCWLRDAYFVVTALNRLGATQTMERYLRYIINVAAGSDNGQLQPVYGINLRADLTEHQVDTLAGYRGMGPVRVGNEAYLQVQNDVYGAAVLAATHVFFDQRIERPGDESLFQRLEVLGEHAADVYDQPDAGPWELRNSRRVHTFSSVMCWAACDRLARIADPAGAGRTRRPLAQPRRHDASHHLREGLGRRAADVRRELRRQGARRQPAAAERARFPGSRRPALRRHRAMRSSVI